MPAKILRELFDKLGVPYESIVHPKRDTALETAKVEGENPDHVAKVVVAEARGKHIMFVLPADRKLDLFKASDGCDNENVRVLYEIEIQDDFPDSEEGAMPPFGSLYGLPVFMEAALTVHPDIVFNAGSHTESFKMKTEDYITLTNPQIGDYAIKKTKATSR